jgi:signal transduction histidine kinase/response regulator RpfG family c-di-GMP phosphodiesterase
VNPAIRRDPRVGPGEPRASPRSEAGLGPARVLIVDDDERNAFAAVQALEDLGYELVVARSGEEALRALLEDDFAVILLDLHMPGMDGYETAALIRQRKRSVSIPIVFLTAIFRDEAHVFQAYSAGAVDVVFKPVDPFILRSKVSILVELHQKTQEMQRQLAYRDWLLAENAKVQAEKQSALQALESSRARQEWILRALPMVFHSRSVQAPFPALFVSDGVEGITGFTPARFTGEPDFGLSRVHPEDLDRVVAALTQAATTGSYACEYRWRCADDQYRYLLDQGVLAAGEDGGFEIFGAILDATERRSLEEQLTQARKMEAVGQLTGGVAHDFNNLLTVVLGNVDYLARQTDDDGKRDRRIEAIRQAASRGRDLTRQLLAFSRRQQLNPVTLEVDALIAGFAPLLRQAVGESVVLVHKASPIPLHLHVDATQLESALLNLAVNARDAMPEGGTLTVTTSAEIGPDGAMQVYLAVSDTGLGMSEAVRARVFEPFFTTKEVGRGSGLGLSQVYGFVRQSNGTVVIDSRPGHGASIRLTLPAAEAPAAGFPETIEGGEAPVVGGAETLLVVDDDPAVLALTVEMLGDLGYRIVTAANAAQALAALKKDPAIDLLFSDVVMPGGVSGVGLARKARVLRPDLRVLLTSGYVGSAAPLAADVPLIDKPYKRADLAQLLRRLLTEDAPPPPPRRRRRADSRMAAE